MEETEPLLETPLEAESTARELNSGFSLPPKHQSPTRTSCWLNVQETRVQGSLRNVVHRARPLNTEQSREG